MNDSISTDDVMSERVNDLSHQIKRRLIDFKKTRNDFLAGFKQTQNPVVNQLDSISSEDEQSMEAILSERKAPFNINLSTSTKKYYKTCKNEVS